MNGGSKMPLEIITCHPETDPHPTPVLFVHGAWHGAWCWEKFFLPYFALSTVRGMVPGAGKNIFSPILPKKDLSPMP
jgi:hypothetical protein